MANEKLEFRILQLDPEVFAPQVYDKDLCMFRFFMIEEYKTKTNYVYRLFTYNAVVQIRNLFSSKSEAVQACHDYALIYSKKIDVIDSFILDVDVA